MADPTPPPPPPAPAPNGRLSMRLFHYLTGIKTWQQLLFTLILGVAIGGGVFAYRHEAELAQMVFDERPFILVEIDEIQPAINKIRELTGAHLVVVFSVDLVRNVQRVIAWSAAEHLHSPLEPFIQRQWLLPSPIFGHHPELTALAIEMLTHGSACGQLLHQPMPELFIAAQIKMLCFVQIPPEKGELVAFLGVGFPEALEPRAQAQTVLALTEIANRLAHR